MATPLKLVYGEFTSSYIVYCMQLLIHAGIEVELCLQKRPQMSDHLQTRCCWDQENMHRHCKRCKRFVCQFVINLSIMTWVSQGCNMLHLYVCLSIRRWFKNNDASYTRAHYAALICHHFCITVLMKISDSLDVFTNVDGWILEVSYSTFIH